LKKEGERKIILTGDGSQIFQRFSQYVYTTASRTSSGGPVLKAYILWNKPGASDFHSQILDKLFAANPVTGQAALGV
jgi:hypothetical protein